MRKDRYARFILTIIAISLTVIALRPLLSPGVADAQLNGCGVDPHHPCYIAGWGPEWYRTDSEQWPFPGESSGWKSIGESDACDGRQSALAILPP
jgi:hypothetical protein